MAQARTVTLILTTTSRGKGTMDDLCRSVYELWTPDGDLVAELDNGGPKGDRDESFVTGVLREL